MTLPASSMPQPSNAFELQLRAQVVESMEMNMMDNARFMAERLHAGFPTEVRRDMHVGNSLQSFLRSALRELRC